MTGATPTQSANLGKIGRLGSSFTGIALQSKGTGGEQKHMFRVNCLEGIRCNGKFVIDFNLVMQQNLTIIIVIMYDIIIMTTARPPIHGTSSP